MIRSFIPVLGTMGFVANTQASQAWLIQPVSIFSIYGLGLIILLTNFALAQVGLALIDRRWAVDDAVPVDVRSTRRWAAGVGIGLAAWIGLSLIILGSAPQNSPTVRVAALQPGFPEPAHVDPSTPQELRVQTLLALGREAAGQGAKVLFTPELGMAIDPQREYTSDFKALTADTGAYAFLTYGFDTTAGFHNEAVPLTPEGQFLPVYGKIHPGPGEPKAIYSDVYPVYETPLGRLATVICMDSNFTDVTRRLAQLGAQLIAVPTRETQGISEQTWTHHVFRAIETRTAIVKTDVAWGSAIIDPYGRILDMKSVPEPTRLALVGDVPLGSGDAPVVQLGDWVGWIALAGFVFFIIFQVVTDRRAKKESSHDTHSRSR
jgi:apolipoprotein N-acyltransferase